MILMSNGAIQAAGAFLMDKKSQPFKRLLLDATGKVTAPIYEQLLLHHVLLAPIP